MNRTLNAIAARLSLRAPQRAALEILAGLYEHAGFAAGADLAAMLAAVRERYPAVEDFEREFPSLCFALATGVGKTRLMGAFITYLHLAHGINNFFVLAPNLTIYNKLIADFTRNTPKYVFKGIAEFAQQSPLIITGDNYDQTGAAVDDQPQGFAHDVRVNIFNISKINSEVRGGKEPRIKRLREVLGAKIGAHRLRHTFASAAANSPDPTGNGLRALQDMLGHTSVITTMGYVHPDMQRQRLLQSAASDALRLRKSIACE